MSYIYYDSRFQNGVKTSNGLASFLIHSVEGFCTEVLSVIKGVVHNRSSFQIVMLRLLKIIAMGSPEIYALSFLNETSNKM